MKKMTWKSQIMTCAGLHAVLFALALITKQGIFNNIAWMIWGLSFIFHPVWPKAWDYADHEKLKLGCRIGGILAILVGLITRFHV